MLICGPNCLGVVNLVERSCGYSSISPKDVAVGDVAVVSQSGTVIVALVRSLRGIGFSHLVSSGNEAVLTSGDYLGYLASDPATKVLGVFLEGIRDPRAVHRGGRSRAARRQAARRPQGRAQRRGSGREPRAHRQPRRQREVHDALFRQNGVTQCDDLDEWIEAIEMFRFARPPASRGIGLIGVSGGENALVLDHAAELGLSVPPLSEAGRRRLGEVPALVRPSGEPDRPDRRGHPGPSLYRKCLEVLADEPHIGIIVVSQDCPAAFDLIAAKATAEVARGSGKCFVYFNNFSGPFRTEVQAVLREAGVPYLQGLRESLKAIKALIAYHLDAPPADARSAADRCRPASRCKRNAGRRAGRWSPRTKPSSSSPATACRSSPRSSCTAQPRPDTPRRGSAIPLSPRSCPPTLPHKAQIGGVRLGLRSAAEAEEAFSSIMSSIAARQPSARIDGVLVQPMVGGGIETIMGLKRDPQFGMTILFGLGGVFVEALRQVAVRLVPIGEADAREMIEDVPVLTAILDKQGGAKDAVATLVRLLLRLSELAVELDDEIEELDLNPVILEPASARATVVDALIVRRKRGDDAWRQASSARVRAPSPRPALRSALRACRKPIARPAATRSAPSKTSRSRSPAASSCRSWVPAAAARARCSRSWPD